MQGQSCPPSLNYAHAGQHEVRSEMRGISKHHGNASFWDHLPIISKLGRDVMRQDDTCDGPCSKMLGTHDDFLVGQAALCALGL